MISHLRKYLVQITVAFIIFSAIFITKFPTLYHALHTPPELFFTGQISWFDAWDINAYVSYIRFGQRHGVLLENTYTLEPHQGVFVFQTYTILGVINRFLNLDPFLLFHIASIITGLLLLLSVFYVVSLVFRSSADRLASFSVIALGGGLGWIKNLELSADYRLAGFTLINTLERSHDALSALFIVLFIGFLGQYINTGKKRFIILSLISSFLVYTIHPPLALISFTVYLLSLFIFQNKINIKYYLKGFSVLLIFYSLYYLFVLRAFLLSPGYKNISGQSLWNPDFQTIILGFGLLMIGIISSFVNKSSRELIKLVKIIFIVQLILLFSPFGFHLYYAKGIFIWGVILAVSGFAFLIKKNYIKFILLPVIIISLPFRIFAFSRLMKADYSNQYYYLDRKEGQTLKFISSLPSDSSLLSLYRIGNVIPAFSSGRVFLGHGINTVDFNRKILLANKFYLTSDTDFQKKFLQNNKIDYVYFGFEEQLLRKNNSIPQFTPPDFLKLIYKNDIISVFEVI